MFSFGWSCRFLWPALLPINSWFLSLSHFQYFLLWHLSSNTSSRSLPASLGLLHLEPGIFFISSLGFPLIFQDVWNVVSSSSNSNNREIDEYHDSTRDSSSSSSNSSRSNGRGSSGGNITNEQYTFRVPGVPLEVLQEELRTRVASESHVGTSTNAPSSTTPAKVETVYSCAVGVPSKSEERRLTSLKSWYEIPNELNPRLAVRGD